MMMLTGGGLSALVSGSLVLLCAVSEAAVGLRCVSLGNRVKVHFRLGTAAGAWYSGVLLAAGQVLLTLTLLRPGGRKLLLAGVLVSLLGVLTAFSGAVVDGDTVALLERKHGHYCRGEAPSCGQLREYQRGLVVSTVLSGLEVLLGLLNLVVVRRYQTARFHRRRRSARIVFNEERDFSVAEFQPVSYINLGVFHVLEQAGVEVQCGGHPSVELPGYSPTDPELDRSYPFSNPLPSERPPAYEDIYPGDESNR